MNETGNSATRSDEIARQVRLRHDAARRALAAMVDVANDAERTGSRDGV